MVTYYVKQCNEQSQLGVVPTLYDSGLIFGDYDSIIEVTLSESDINKLNNMFFFRNSEYAVNPNNFIYSLDSYSVVTYPPPKNHSAYKDLGTGLTEQMAIDLTDNKNDVASFENKQELRTSIDNAIKGMMEGQKCKLKNQGTKTHPIGKENSIVYSLLTQFNESCIPSGRQSNSECGWNVFHFQQGDCLAFNFTFLSPGNLNEDSWNDIAMNQKGTDLTYSVRLLFNNKPSDHVTQCETTKLYEDYGSNK